MNTFGRLFRVSILGESHGECVGVLLDGVPAGLPLSTKEFATDLERRKSGAKGTTTRKETDEPLIKSGVFEGKTTGAPILILFENKDVDSRTYEQMQLKNNPRPGHADLVAKQKFGGFNDYRGGGHFSGRLTVALVAAGVVAKKLITPIKTTASVVEVGGAKTTTEIEKVIDNAVKDGDSVGGVIECRVTSVPVGLGEPFFDSTESLLSHIVFSIPAIKGIEFGAGFACSKMRGSECNDAILSASGKTATNNAGGINGGITNGNELVFRVAVKPAASIKKTTPGRHDVCIALRVPVILEAVTAIVLADLMLMEQKIERVEG